MVNHRLDQESLNLQAGSGNMRHDRSARNVLA